MREQTRFLILTVRTEINIWLKSFKHSNYNSVENNWSTVRKKWQHVHWSVYAVVPMLTTSYSFHIAIKIKHLAQGDSFALHRSKALRRTHCSLCHWPCLGLSFVLLQQPDSKATASPRVTLPVGGLVGGGGLTSFSLCASLKSPLFTLYLLTI